MVYTAAFVMFAGIRSSITISIWRGESVFFWNVNRYCASLQLNECCASLQFNQISRILTIQTNIAHPCNLNKYCVFIFLNRQSVCKAFDECYKTKGWTRMSAFAGTYTSGTLYFVHCFKDVKTPAPPPPSFVFLLFYLCL